jgi:hypothetical protein
MILVIGAMLIICIASSTAADRSAARDRMRAWDRYLWIPTALIVFLVATAVLYPDAFNRR